jgi:crotonobetainyl-CoA:carnitine CoA-transferase CaiB-like acyl-CoA transferase
VRTPSPTLGEHTEQVLRELLGLAAPEIAALRAARAIT